MKLLSPEQSSQMRSFVVSNALRVVDTESVYDSPEEESDLEEKKRLYMLGLALSEFSQEVFIIYFPERINALDGFEKVWEQRMSNQCLLVTKEEVCQVDDLIPEYYIFNQDGSKFVFVDAEGNISFTKYGSQQVEQKEYAEPRYTAPQSQYQQPQTQTPPQPQPQSPPQNNNPYPQQPGNQSNSQNQSQLRPKNSGF